MRDAVEKGWRAGWRKRGWKKADGKPALNRDLWEQLSELLALHKVRLHWVEAHAGHAENEEVDALAKAAASRPGLPKDTGFEPKLAAFSAGAWLTQYGKTASHQHAVAATTAPGHWDVHSPSAGAAAGMPVLSQHCKPLLPVSRRKSPINPPRTTRPPRFSFAPLSLSHTTYIDIAGACCFGCIIRTGCSTVR